MAVGVATDMHILAKSLLQWPPTWTFYYLCQWSVFKGFPFSLHPFLRVAQCSPIRRKLFQVNMAQQALLVHSCCTCAWSPFLPEDGCKEGNVPCACDHHLCHLIVLCNLPPDKNWRLAHFECPITLNQNLSHHFIPLTQRYTAIDNTFVLRIYSV